MVVWGGSRTGSARARPERRAPLAAGPRRWRPSSCLGDRPFTLPHGALADRLCAVRRPLLRGRDERTGRGGGRRADAAATAWRGAGGADARQQPHRPRARARRHRRPADRDGPRSRRCRSSVVASRRSPLASSGSAAAPVHANLEAIGPQQAGLGGIRDLIVTPWRLRRLDCSRSRPRGRPRLSTGPPTPRPTRGLGPSRRSS